MGGSQGSVTQSKLFCLNRPIVLIKTIFKQKNIYIYKF